MNRKQRFVLLLAVLVAAAVVSGRYFSPPVVAAYAFAPDTDHFLFTPFIQNHHRPQQPLDWDERLTLRGAAVVSAQVTAGQGYWRLVKAVWYDEEESQGKHHIFVDTLDTSGERQVGVPVLILNGGSFTIITEAKPGESYAANYPMFSPAPAYSAVPDSGAPADQVTGLGLGDLEHPDWSIHTSYGLTWQWTVAP